MSELSYELERETDRKARDWGHLTPHSRELDHSGVSRAWLLFGVAALALGAVAVYHFAPDFRRYLKMRNM
jgi:hypothetical protein